MCALVAQNADNARLVVQEKGVAPLVRFVLPFVFDAAPRTGSVWPAAGASAEALHKLLSLVMTLVIELLRLVMTLVIELLSLDDLGAV
jgi:hypothetical protein